MDMNLLKISIKQFFPEVQFFSYKNAICDSFVARRRSSTYSKLPIFQNKPSRQKTRQSQILDHLY